MSAPVLLVDTRAAPSHCAFIAFLRGDRESGEVRVGTCCNACFKALRITLRLGGLGHLRIRRD